MPTSFIGNLNSQALTVSGPRKIIVFWNERKFMKRFFVSSFVCLPYLAQPARQDTHIFSRDISIWYGYVVLLPNPMSFAKNTFELIHTLVTSFPLTIIVFNISSTSFFISRVQCILNLLVWLRHRNFWQSNIWSYDDFCSDRNILTSMFKLTSNKFRTFRRFMYLELILILFTGLNRNRSKNKN